MFQISADLTVLSQAQREAIAAFILSFPSASGDDAVIPCPIMEEEPTFDAPLPAGIVALPIGGPSQVDPPTPGGLAPLALVTPTNLDKNGLPWDERIHAGSRTKNQDGSWRYKRGVESRVVEPVEAELRALMNLPAVPPPPAAPATASPIMFPLPAMTAVSIPPVPAVPAAAPVPSITASPVVSAPTVASANPFISLITFAGAKNMEGKLSDAEIQAACNAVGVPAIPLMTNRHDLCPHVEASLRLLVANR